MATLLSLPNMQSIFVNCGNSNSSNLVVNPRHTLGKKIYNHSGRLGKMRKFHRGESMHSFMKFPFHHLNKVYATSGVSVEKIEQRFSTVTEIENPKRVFTYLFRTEFGDLVKVYVTKTNVDYAVFIEVSSLNLGDDRLILSWGTYRSDSSDFLSPYFQDAAGSKTTETPLIRTPSGSFVHQLGFEAKQFPFYLSFLLKRPGEGGLSGSIRSHRKSNFCVPVGFGTGQPFPLGPSFSSDSSVNFSFFSRTADRVVLCLYDDSTDEKPALEIELDPYINRSGDVWHASFDSAWNFVSYGYRCKGFLNHGSDAGNIILDPYAKVIWNSILSKHLGHLRQQPSFNWDDDSCPNLPMEKLMVYRLNVTRFTGHKSSHLPTNVAGTFAGLTEKLQHFKDMGVNAVLLEPIFPFEEHKGPYFPFHFFSPLHQNGPSEGPLSAISSMKTMVKQLHANGIEVLLEVVFTHTAEDGALQGIDDFSYYYKNRVADLEARHALNCNYPVVQQMILDSLRHWVTEFHVDGFCFINASSLMRSFHGEFLSRPPLVEAIAFDPILSQTKIIADFWDPQDSLSKDMQFPHWKRWSEMNTKFCMDVRNFWRGESLLSTLATRLCGSGDIFSDGRGPAFSFNYIARNSGLPLVDLVSFSGSELASELSWNCGEEGPTNNTVVLERRLKQIRNFLFVLYVSLGIPVLNMGDECGLSSNGSVAYNNRKPFDWNALKTGFGNQTTQFISFLSSIRVRHGDLLQRRTFLKEENIIWYGSDHTPPKWDDPSSKFLALMLKADEGDKRLNSETPNEGEDLFIALNASDHPEAVILPILPQGLRWHMLVDTALPFPGFFSKEGELVPEQMAGFVSYKMKSHSCALFEARNSSD